MASSATLHSVDLDEIGVPLVILSPACAGGPSRGQPCQPARPAGDRGRPAGSLGRLTVPGPLAGGVLGLAARASTPGSRQPSPFRAGQCSRVPTAARPRQGRLGFQMSLVASGRHYIRDGTGAEGLYDLSNDPFELVNLMNSTPGKEEVEPFRRMLLKVLTDNPGSIEVENAYMKEFRQALGSVVEESTPPPVPISALEKGSSERRD